MRLELSNPQEEFYLRLLQVPLKDRPAEVLGLSQHLTEEDSIAFRRTFAFSFSVLRK